MGSCDVEERALLYLGLVKKSEPGFTLTLSLALGLLPNLAFTSKLGCLTKQARNFPSPKKLTLI